jgi:hypothetical protein
MSEIMLRLFTTQTHYAASALTAEENAPTWQERTGDQLARWREYIFSPLWLCLLITLGLRIFLVIHTHGVIDGDEALVGIQADRILHGDFPIYFYGQAYMGSLEAYFIAMLFAFFGSSVWVLRAEPILLSLAVVSLTWHLASLLIETTSLSRNTRRIFMTVAALCAAIPPLYDGVIEGRTYGGFIEMLSIILLLFICTIRLTRRWFEGASKKELAWRWAGVGFLVGLGFWIYPLIASAALAVVLWISGSAILAIYKNYKRSPQEARRSLSMLFSPIKYCWLAVTAIPAAMLGMAPALYWGATHQWANIAFVLSLNGQETLHQKLSRIFKVTRSFKDCVAPNIIGGSVPLESSLSVHIHQGLFVLGLIFIVVTLGSLAISYFRPDSHLIAVRQMAGLPALFAVCCVLLFCVSSASASELAGCTNDWAGRYAAPMLLALPFFCAAAFTLGWSFLQSRYAPSSTHTDPIQSADHMERQPEKFSPHRSGFIMQALLVLLLLTFLGTQVLTYGLTSPGETYQSNYCFQDPFDNGPLLSYMQEQHIQYFWANNLLAYPLVFKSHLSIIAADPTPLLHPEAAINRIPSDTDAVLHANRPSMLFLIPHDDTHPQILQALSNLHVTYHTARFYAQPGYDVVVVTPVSRSVSPLESPQLDLFGCVSH